MVAYSFQKQFAPPIQAGTKTGTIRADRKRHARVGEDLQLYRGMRTKYCEKIIPDPVCLGVHPITIDVRPHTFGIIEVGLPRWLLHRHGHDFFAQKDGFENIDAMHAFWRKHHGVGLFEGFWIRWEEWASSPLSRYFQ